MPYNNKLNIGVVCTHSKTAYGISECLIEVRKWKEGVMQGCIRVSPYMELRKGTKILTIKLISQIYFWNKTLHISDSSSAHNREFFTVNTANLYDIYHCSVYSEKLLMMDRGTVRNM